MNRKKIYRKNKNIVSREIDNEMILVPIYRTAKDINEMYTLNKTAKDLWEMVDGKNSVDDIRSKMLARYNVIPGKLDTDIAEFIKDMREIKAIE